MTGLKGYFKVGGAVVGPASLYVPAPAVSTLPPTARVTPGPVAATVSQPVTVDALASEDPAGGTLSFSWAVLAQPAGSSVTGSADGGSFTLVPTHADPATSQDYVVEVTVTSSVTGLSATATTWLSVAEPSVIAGEPNTATVEARLLTDPDVLWVGTFESPDWQQRWGVSNIDSSANIAVDTHAVAGAQGRTLRGKVPANQTKGFGFHSTFSLISSGPSFPAQEVCHLRYRFFASWDFVHADGSGHGKLPGLAGKIGTTNLSRVGAGGQRWNGSTEVTASTLEQADGFSARGMFHRDGSVGVYLYVPDLDYVGAVSSKSYFGASPRLKTSSGSNMKAVMGAWNDFEIAITMNTPGSKNGVIKAWLNGVQGLNLTNVRLRGADRSALKVSQIFASWFYGGGSADAPPTDQFSYFDDFVIAKSYIGPRGASEVAAPVVTAHPASATVAAGAKASFSASATGWTVRRWEYEETVGDWRAAAGFSVVDSGGTTTYTSNDTNDWHNGRRYRCVFGVTDGPDTATNPATLTVTSSTGGGGGDTPAGLSDQMVFYPLSDSGWAKHVQSGHDTDVRIIAAAEGGLPVTPYLTARITHHSGDVFGGGSRAEYRPKPDVGQTEGVAYWLAYAVWLPATEPVPNSWGRIRWQMHGGSGSPTIAMRHDVDDTWKLDIRGGSSTSPSSLVASTGVAVARGAWTKFKLYVLPSDTTAGITRLWINGTQRVDQTRRNRYTGSSGYMKFGVYGSDTGATTSVSVLVPHISRSEADIDTILASF